MLIECVVLIGHVGKCLVILMLARRLLLCIAVVCSMISFLSDDNHCLYWEPESGSCGLVTVNLLCYLLAIALFVGFCIAGLFGYVCRGRNALLLIRFFTARGRCMGYLLNLFVCNEFLFPVGRDCQR